MSGLVKVTHKGGFNKFESWCNHLLRRDYLNVLDKYGQMGVATLSAATPKDTGETAESWDYIIERGPTESKIIWTNSNVNKGVVIAILLQYGHGTGTGGYVVGQDYINPAMIPIFENIAKSAWKEALQV